MVRTRGWRGLLVASVIALGLGGGTAAAGSPSTWYVAPDGSGGGSCATPDFTSIQDAIDAAGRRDTIRVCPGRYTESLLILGARDGLTIVATVPGKAVLRVPPAPANGVGVVIESSSFVRLRGLTLQASRAAVCTPPSHMIFVAGEHAVLRDLRLSGAGSHCRPFVGIEAAAAGAWIGYNQIRDWSFTAIRGGASELRIVRNSVRVRGVGDAIFAGGEGTVVRGNAVTVTGDPALGSAGIQVSHGATAVGNRVAGAWNGIFVQPVIGGFVIRENLVLDSVNDGIQLLRTTHGQVIDNVVRRSGGTDCVESDPLSPSDWSGNTGLTSNPAGLCTPPPG
jgi:Right handed beta helix region